MIDEKKLEKACYFDSIGLFIKKDESIDEYIKRAEKILSFCDNLRKELNEKGKIKLDKDIILKDQLLEYNDSGYQKVKEYYDMDLNWIIGFYDNSIGFLQGAAEGIYSDEKINDIPFICLKSSFQKKDVYLGMYKKDECIAHELVHAGRENLAEKKYHELFAYKMNSNLGAKYLPGFVRWAWESYAVFLSTVFGFVYSMFYDLGSIYGYIPLIFFMCYLLIRNFIVKRFFDNLIKKFKLAFNKNGLYILARITEDDMEFCEFLKPDQIKDFIIQNNDLRYEIIRRRYLS